MKLQTVIEHELEIIEVKPSMTDTSITVYGEFKIKHSPGIKNNTITLQNLVRTSPEFAKYVESIILSSFDFKSLNPYHMPFRTPGYFGISPRGAKKGSFYFSMSLSEDTLREPVRYIRDIIGGC